MAIEDGYAICFNEWALDKNIKCELGLLLIISGLTAEQGFCFAKNKYFAELFNESEDSISRKIKKLESLGYITCKKNAISDKSAYTLLNKKNSKTGCLFWGYNKFVLDKHHYPIRAKNGGTKTIDLCPNCHRAFHCLTGDFETTYKIFLNQKYLDKIKNIREELLNGKS